MPYLSCADNSGLTIPTGGILLPDPPEPYSPTLASMVLMSMILFVAGYALGSGNIPWQQGELFRLEVRGVGTSICTAVNWYVHVLPFPINPSSILTLLPLLIRLRKGGD
jgi:hypothetical protein